MTVGTRLALILCGLAGFSTGLAMLLQDRALSADLRAAAAGRLERAASVTGQLLEGHLEALQDRYRAISLTPEFRANLETNHSATLAYYAVRLAIQQQLSALLFTDPDGLLIAASGAERLTRAAASHRPAAGLDPCSSDLAQLRRWVEPVPAPEDDGSHGCLEFSG